MLRKLHKILKWVIVIQILLTVTSSEEATIVTGIIGLALGVLYVRFTDWFYKDQHEG